MTQDEPIMHGSGDAGRDEKVAGVVEQVRADAELRDSEEVEQLLRQRFEETGLQVSDEEFARHLDDIRGGPSVAD
jgi:ADP-ribose pyrophosphatase YjhB (NUDIX family)